MSSQATVTPMRLHCVCEGHDTLYSCVADAPRVLASSRSLRPGGDSLYSGVVPGQP